MADYGYENMPMGRAMRKADKPKGKKPKDAPKLPEGWRYMPDGKVVAKSDMDDEDSLVGDEPNIEAME